MKKLATLAILALASLSLVYAGGTPRAKSYSIVLAHATKAGSVQLKPGEYSLKVVEGNAVFTDVQTSKAVSVPVKVETGDKKFSDTIVETTTVSGSEVIKDIELGGSKEKVEFSN